MDRRSEVGTAMKDRIDAYLQSHQQQIAEDIQALVRIESINGDQEGNRKALGFVMQKAAWMGIPCRMTREEDVVLAQIGSGEEKVGILVHVDVVGIGDRGKWTHPPFSGHFDGEYIWGRGSLDDKGAVIASLYVLKALLDLKLPLKKLIWLIVGTGEEGGDWQDITEHFKRDFGFPDYGFSPDGDFPIYNMENGYGDIELEFTEPKRDELVCLSAGSSTNTIPSRAVIQFRGQAPLEFHGLSAHSSTPGLGENAIKSLCRGLSSRQDLNFLGFIGRYLLADDNGSQLGLDPQDDYTKPGSAARNSICVPTVLKLTEQGVCLNVNVRHKYGITEQEILHQFEVRAREYGYTVKLFHYHPPLMIDEQHPVLQLMKSVYESHGFKNEFKVGFGTSYAKSMDNFVSWGPNFPDTVNCAHMENERISIRSLMTAAKIYTLFLVRCASAGINDGMKCND
jgi:succinyl-diaminopimelate desuccinylase